MRRTVTPAVEPSQERHERPVHQPFRFAVYPVASRRSARTARPHLNHRARSKRRIWPGPVTRGRRFCGSFQSQPLKGAAVELLNSFPPRGTRRSVSVVLERGEAIGLLVILAIMLAATLYVAVRRTPSFGVVFAPVELALASWVTRTARWNRPPVDPPSGRPPTPGDPPSWPHGDGGGGGVREPRRPRPSSGAGTVSRPD